MATRAIGTRDSRSTISKALNTVALYATGLPIGLQVKPGRKTCRPDAADCEQGGSTLPAIDGETLFGDYPHRQLAGAPFDAERCFLTPAMQRSRDSSRQRQMTIIVQRVKNAGTRLRGA